MSFIIKVKVQLPDGSIQFLPVVHRTDKGDKIVEQPTLKEAWVWKNYILPERAIVEKNEE